MEAFDRRRFPRGGRSRPRRGRYWRVGRVGRRKASLLCLRRICSSRLEPGGDSRGRRRRDKNIQSPGGNPPSPLVAGRISIAVPRHSERGGQLLMRAEGMHHAWVALFLTEFLFWVPWYTATPLVRYLGRRYAIQWRGWGALLVHILACMSITLVSAAWSSGLDEVLNPLVKPQNPEPFIPLWLDTVYSGLLLSLFLYAAILSFSYLVESGENLADERVRSAHLSGQLAKAELESLRRQVEPHSLFNSLNAISGLVREGRNAAAVTAIATLGEVLRKIIEHPDHQEVSLAVC
jgi:hypothetical protein